MLQADKNNLLFYNWHLRFFFAWCCRGGHQKLGAGESEDIPNLIHSHVPCRHQPQDPVCHEADLCGEGGKGMVKPHWAAARQTSSDMSELDLQCPIVCWWLPTSFFALACGMGIWNGLLCQSRVLHWKSASAGTPAHFYFCSFIMSFPSFLCHHFALVVFVSCALLFVISLSFPRLPLRWLASICRAWVVMRCCRDSLLQSGWAPPKLTLTTPLPSTLLPQRSWWPCANLPLHPLPHATPCWY